ncbi:hypothetical protein AT03_15145 [Hafnia alvei FB1]|uniref:HipA-like kinase domain-containing protein n=1 Tax=Hafnia alvei FB1 TaxID=1453496 RepID=A0A097R4E6_HAFAL|nr:MULTISPECIES: HipA family kinase [Hafnia]MDN6109312.1 hypothetical protein [Enterobacterales bacterium]MDN6519102.1 hypothetical protein [Enterococcus sp.]AIU73595.1 hypothetical protein AT03_15145 [Hafnia alvei FB1]MBU2671810.1 hypothetical protein [Hafnia paralvei]MCK2182147.1 hypothetical protein [Hafnia paralvei]
MIRIGRLLPGGVIVEEGQHRPIKGVAILPTRDGDTEEVVVFAKQISSRSISTEITCAALGRCLSLPIPEPVILFDENDLPFFGSVDTAYPSFSQYINDASDKSVLEKLESWPLLRKAAYFDEWIAMDDRHNGNLLFNGDGFYLIDHESAIPSGLSPEQSGIEYYSNQLLQIASSLLDRKNELAVQMAANEARAWSVSNRQEPIENLDVVLSSSVQEKTKNQILSFLAARIEVLGDILYEQIKPKQVQMDYDAKP